MMLCQLNLTSLEDRGLRHFKTLTYKTINNMAPCYLSEKFCRTDTVHKHNFRGSCHNLFVPRPLTEARKESFSYRGAVVWNSLPEEAKSAQNLIQFKSFI